MPPGTPSDRYRFLRGESNSVSRSLHSVSPGRATASRGGSGGSSREQILDLCAGRFGYSCRLSMSELQARDGFDASCQGTVPLAVAAFFHSKDFEDALRIAVSLGGDTDTLACIAGALAEAHYRVIPPPCQAEALRRLDAPLREELHRFAERFQLVHLAASMGVAEALAGKERLTWEQAQSARRVAA